MTDLLANTTNPVIARNSRSGGRAPQLSTARPGWRRRATVPVLTLVRFIRLTLSWCVNLPLGMAIPWMMSLLRRLLFKAVVVLEHALIFLVLLSICFVVGILIKLQDIGRLGRDILILLVSIVFGVILFVSLAKMLYEIYPLRNGEERTTEKEPH